jgi:hypothetical protein
MVSASATSSTRDVLEDRFLTFNCYKFSRGINATRPLSRRWVLAEECLCTRDTTDKICDRNTSYSLHFRETTEEEVSEIMNRITDPDIPWIVSVFFCPMTDLILSMCQPSF